jgi:putative ABC transport system permease protein
MLKSYFRIAWRTLTRNGVYTIVNTLGLALGICACLVIWLVQHYEFSFDRFQPDRKLIYRINTYEQYSKDEPVILRPSVMPAFPAAVRANIPGIGIVAPYHIFADATAGVPGGGPSRNAFPSSPIVTTPEYFGIMKYDWLAGSEKTALSEPYKVVLSERTARIYFGSGSLNQMIGRELVYNDSLHVNVSGIVRDWKENTDFPYTEFISLSTAEHSFLRDVIQLDQKKGIPSSSRVLLKIQKGGDPDKVQAALSALFDKDGHNKFEVRIALQPLADVHFADTGESAGIRTAHLPTLYALLGIAVFILLLAVINYVNLATAQAITRDKEVGIRKVMGSSRTSLMIQFLSETFLLTLFAAGIACLMVRPVLAAFHSFIPPGVQFHPATPAMLIFLVGVVTVTTLLAGLYPARVLSSYVPVVSLRGAGSPRGSEKWWLRKGLIVFQFTVSLIFIIGTLGISRQIRYMLNTDLGFRYDAIIDFNTNDRRHLDKVKLLEQNIRQLPGVLGVARENMPPMGTDRGATTVQYRARSEEKIQVAMIKADENFIPLYRIRLLAGRNLLPGDTLREVVINESLSKMLGFKRPEQAIGQIISTWDQNVPIAGVVADFHQASFHETIKPQLIVGIACSDIAVRLDTKGKSVGEAKAILARIEKQWKDIYPKTPFEYSFLDEDLAQLYKKEQTTAWLMNIATGITIFISCMGLFGLTMFTAERRTREIGIRKVLGASVSDIVTLLSKDFVILVSIALIIASPLAWIFMHKWLQGFAYRIHFGIDIFLIAGSGILFITLLTISFLTVKAALANPVKNLRTE